MEPIDGTLEGTNTPGQSGPGSSDDEGVLHIPQTSRTGTSPSEFNVIPRTKWSVARHGLLSHRLLVPIW